MKESFPITSVSREDLEELGFDTSEISDETMEYLAKKLGDDYCEQLFWTSLNIIAEYMEIPKRKILDREGNELHVGDKAIWYDPEENARDLTRIYTVDAIISEEMITISDGYSEAEVQPNELKIVES